ncbi:hypothetical protein GCM10023196_008060 [Actinoallomurus vinaceus]|uniref:ABM domain-containing protein n=1 Tax=Actinoallomurus vinaceus TaxID=1080074 RepID=A0ABP8U4S5_9ACTN
MFLSPVVRDRRTGRYLFLLAWEQRGNGSWQARVAWVEQRPASWRVAEAWMRGQDLEPVEGQNYRQVPRRYEEPDF